MNSRSRFLIAVCCGISLLLPNAPAGAQHRRRTKKKARTETAVAPQAPAEMSDGVDPMASPAAPPAPQQVLPLQNSLTPPMKRQKKVVIVPAPPPPPGREGIPPRP